MNPPEHSADELEPRREDDIDPCFGISVKAMISGFEDMIYYESVDSGMASRDAHALACRLGEVFRVHVLAGLPYEVAEAQTRESVLLEPDLSARIACDERRA